MFDTLLSLIAPHHCYGCQKTGTVLCQNCKNYIAKNRYQQCLVCGQPSAKSNLCQRHRLPYRAAWCVAGRTGAAKQLVDQLKFYRVSAAAAVIAELLDAALPRLDASTVIVPIPTTPANIRRRGYDHMQLICRQLAKQRGLRLESVLRRRFNITQHFASSAAVRRRQAQRFFAVRGAPLNDTTTYLLVDDIFTTGATLRAAAVALRRAGASQVQVASFLRHQGN